VGEKTPGEWRDWLEHPYKDDYNSRPTPRVQNQLDLYARQRLAVGIGGCGPAAAPYAPYLLWALKLACGERETARATVPVAELGLPREQFQREIDQSLKPCDDLIAALVDALASIGPGALDVVLQVAGGAYDDRPQPVGTYSMSIDHMYDQRLRAVAAGVLGGLGVRDEKVTRLLVSNLSPYEDAGSPLSRYYDPNWSQAGIDAMRTLRKATAAGALGNLGVASDDVVAALLDTAKDDDASVREAAVAALRKLAGWEYPQTSEGKSI
jgi:hypothetical protein